ncbi:hypothetical protein BHM03_00036901 [Ensete ventricosum]|nr:hypothetical protein BHM03_00036901 [Ensete ventricosum]
MLHKILISQLLRNLVERRRMVKSWLKTASGLKVQQFDIQQQALKLTANRLICNISFLCGLKDLCLISVKKLISYSSLFLGYWQVIYGDTDSIMIYSGLDDIAKAKAIAGKVIQEVRLANCTMFNLNIVNKKYRCLEIDLDGLYKRMLLLKKKKYAAVKVLFKDGMPYEVIERKDHSVDTIVMSFCAQFQFKSSESVGQDPFSVLSAIIDEEERYKVLATSSSVKRQAESFICTYYKGLMMNIKSRCVVLQYTEADLYKQLSYFCHVLDATRFLEKVKICFMIDCIALSYCGAIIYWNYMAAVGTKSYGAY